MTLTLLVCGAVPIQGGDQPSRKGATEEFLNIVAWETLQMILTPAPVTPPNSPTSSSTFTFPAPAEEVSTRLQKPSRAKASSTKLVPEDGNDADESEAEELEPVPRRKRTRVCSFSGSAPNLRRVPNKKTKEVVKQEDSSTEDLKSVDTTDLCRVTPEVWKNVGSELKAIAEKFSRNGGVASFKRSVGGNEISKNVVTIAINIFIWKLMKRLMN